MPDRFQIWVSSLEEWRRKSYDEQLSKWSPEQRTRANELASLLDKLGCSEPEDWVFSEVTEGIAQVLRFAFLMAVRKEVEFKAKHGLESLADDDPKIASSIGKISQVLSNEELREIFAAFGKQLADDLIHLIDQGCSSQLIDPGTSWALLEVNSDCKPSGRDVGGLHEDSWEEDFRPRV